MTDPIRDELHELLDDITLGEQISCGYHDSPTGFVPDEPVLCEAIRIIEHPQREDYPGYWVIDAIRCEDHIVDEIVEPTRGFEEALIRVPMTTTTNGVSVSTPEIEDVQVFDVSLATEGLHPMVLNEAFLELSKPDDYGLSRWTRILPAVEALDDDSALPLREHLEAMIERSPEVPAELR